MGIRHESRRKKLIAFINSEKKIWQNQDITINFDNISLNEFVNKTIGLFCKKSFKDSDIDKIDIKASINYKRKLNSFFCANVFRPDSFCITLKHKEKEQQITYKKQIKQNTYYVLEPSESNDSENIIDFNSLKTKISSTYLKNDFVDYYEIGWSFVNQMYVNLRKQMNSIGIESSEIIDLFINNDSFTAIDLTSICFLYEDLIKIPDLFKSVLKRQIILKNNLNKFTVLRFIDKYTKDVAQNYFESEQFNRIYLNHYCANNKALTSLRNSGFFK